MPDLDIITRPARIFASIHANTEDGRHWIMSNLPDREASVVALFPAPFIGEYAGRIARERLKVRVRERCGNCS